MCDHGHSWEAAGATQGTHLTLRCRACGLTADVAVPGPDQPDQETLAPAAASQKPDQPRELDADSAELANTRTAHGSPASAADFPRVPGYQILAELGRGGMGVVYKARQVALGRTVALKMVLAGAMASERDVQRFRREAEAVARLHHPHIVQIFEVGQAQGRPFFSLEYVAGGSLANRLDGTPLPAREAALLVQAVARGVHHAHLQGIVHRDLKPANVLLDSRLSMTDLRWKDQHGMAAVLPLESENPKSTIEHCVPKITDFGLAKQLDQERGQTQSGAIVGTPSYMAPEQAGGQHREVGPAADVYALGAVLYELLTGRPPFKAATPLDTAVQVVTEEPIPPSRLQPRLARDLETVCLKCLEKRPARRYASAEELAEELGRFIRGEPVRARPVGALGRLARWCRRQPGLAAALALAALALVAGTIVSTLFAFWATQAAAEEARAAARLRKERQRTQQALSEAQTQRGLAENHRRLAERERGRAERERYETASRLAENYLDRGLAACADDEDIALGLLWFCQGLEAAPAKNSGLRHALRTNLTAWAGNLHRLQAVVEHRGPAVAAAFSPNGKVMVTASQDGTARLWACPTGQPLGDPMQHQGPVTGLAVSSDGRIVATQSGTEVRLWSAATGQSLGTPLRHERTVHAIAFSPDSRILLTGTSGALNERSGGEKTGAAQLWRVATGRPIGEPIVHAGGITVVAFSPNGDTVLTGSGRGEARLWSVKTGRPLAKAWQHEHGVYAAAFSPDGQVALTGSGDFTSGEARLYSAANGQPIGIPLVHKGGVTTVAFRPDGHAVLTGSQDGTARLWLVATGQPLGKPMRHQRAVTAVAFSPDSKSILTASADRTAQLWSATTGQRLSPPFRHQAPVQVACFSPDGKAVLTGSADRTARLWAVPTVRDAGKPVRQQEIISAIAFQPNSNRLLTVEHRTDRLLLVAIGQAPGKSVQQRARFMTVAFSPDGNSFATGSRDRTARLWSVATGRPLGKAFPHPGVVYAVAFGRDNHTLATGCGNEDTETGEARLWSVKTGEPVGRPFQHPDRVTADALSPDGQTVLTGCQDGKARRWSAATGQPIGNPLVHQGGILAVTFSPDGETVLTGSADQTAQRWSAATGRPLAKPFMHQGPVFAVAFSPDGQTIITGSDDETARLWSAATGRLVGPPLQHPSWVKVAAFSPNGKTVVTGGGEGAWLWQLPTPATDDATRTRLFAQVATRTELDDQGRLSVLDFATWQARRLKLASLSK
jgi:WD40 repeat protein